MADESLFAIHPHHISLATPLPSNLHVSELIHRNNLSPLTPLVPVPIPVIQSNTWPQHLSHPHIYTHSHLVPPSPNPGPYARPARGPAVLQKPPWRNKNRITCHNLVPAYRYPSSSPVGLVIRRVRESLFCWICTLMRDGRGCQGTK